MALVSPDGYWEEVNQRLCDITGYAAHELIGRKASELTHPEDVEQDLLAEAGLRSGENQTFTRDKRILCKDGSACWVQITEALQRKPNGRPSFFIAVTEDIRARKATEQSLRESLELLEDIQQLGHIGSWAWDFKQDIPVWSREMFHMFGLDPSGKPLNFQEVEGYFMPESWVRLSAAVQQTLQDGVPYSVETRVIRADGGTGWAEARGEAMRDANGEICALRGMMQDITDRKQIDFALRDGESRMRLLIEHAPMSLAMFDTDVRYLAASRQWREDYGLGEREILAHSHYEIFPEIPAFWREVHQRGLRGEVIRKERDRFERLDGTVQWLRWEVRPWHDLDGQVAGIVIFSEDITQRIQAEEALRESEERYRSLFYNNYSVILIIDQDTGSIVDANPAAINFYGWDADELRRMNIAQINTLPADKIHEAMQCSDRGSQRHFFFQHRRADGSIRDVEVFSGPIPVQSRVLLCTIVYDITERRLAEAAIRDSRAKLEAALENMQDAVLISDMKGNAIEFNEAFSTFHKFESKEDCAKNFNGYQTCLEMFYPDGQVTPISQWAVPRALRGEKASNAVYELRRRDTGESWVASYSFAPIRDDSGEIMGAVVVGRDITEAKRMEDEIQQLNTHLEQRIQERTAELQAANTELESFAYAVSHDLRAPLRAMNGFSLALMEDLSPKLENTEKNFLNQIVLASNRMSDLIDGILQLSRVTRGELHRGWVDLSDLVERIRTDLEASEPRREVVWKIASNLQAWGDPRLIEAMMRNLIGNAWKYTEGRHPAIIGFRRGEARFVVEDNGAGFDMAHATKLFQPFQRLHRQDEFPGIGIGLATVQRIIHRHGGSIQAEAHPNQGARFEFTLPSPAESQP